MYRDLLSSVTELTHRLRQEQAVLARALVEGRQVRTGTDESGTITVLIDDEGAARDVRIAADWRRRLSPAEVGPAVVAADGAAALRRGNATVEALTLRSTEDGGRSDEDDRARGLDPDGLGLLAALLPVPPPGPAARPAAPRRSLAEIYAAVLAAVDDLDRVAEPPPPICGTGAQGAVRVTLAQGRIIECVINQAWLVRQDEVTLAHALREAICAAAAAGVTARVEFIEFQQRLGAIVADALAGGARP